MREILAKTLGSEKPDRVPVIPFVMQYAAKVANVDYRDYCKKGEEMAKAQIKCFEEFGHDAVNVSSDAHRLADALGGKLDFPRNGVPRVTEPPINNQEDLMEAEVPDPKNAERCVERIKAIRKIKKQILDVPVIGWIEGALSDASSIHGVEQTLIGLRKEKEFVEDLLRFSMKFDIEFAKAQIDAGADIIGAGDSLASQVSEEDFKKTLRYTREIFDEINTPTLYHVCGDTNHQLDNLKESNADIIDLDWEVDLKKARKKFGTGICIRGNINTSAFVNEGPPKIEELSLKCIEDAGQDGNFILSGGCEIPPNTKKKSLEAMISTAKNYEYE